MLGVTTALLCTSFPSLRFRGISIDISTFWGMGFGQLQPFTYLVLGLPRQDPAGLILNVLLANLPKVLLSFIYLFYNS